MSHRAERGLHVGMSLAERAEVAIVQEHAGGLVHLPEVERVMHLTGVGPQERLLAGVDIVAIHTAGGGKAGVHAVGDGHDALHGDVSGQQPVEFVGKLPGVDGGIGVEMGHHHPGMDAGIGPAGTSHRRRAAQKCGERAFQLFLHRDAVGLYLPAMKTGAVIA